MNDCTGTVHYLLKCIGEEKGLEWERIAQGPFSHICKKFGHKENEIQETSDSELTVEAVDYLRHYCVLLKDLGI